MKKIYQLLKQNKQAYIQNLTKKKTLNKQRVSNKSVSLNNTPLGIKFAKINSDSEMRDNVYCNVFDDYTTCFLLTWENKVRLSQFVHTFDLVICDLNWKVIELYELATIGSKDIELKRNCHIFLMCPNTIQYKQIKIDDYLKPF